jgi:hypothetical protein
MANEAEAKKTHSDIQGQIAAVTSGGGQVPPDVQKIAKSVKVTQAGDTVTLKLSMTEKEVMSLIGMAIAAGAM